MLWCWARRYWAERRLSQARELFDAARKAGPRVNIELLLGLSRLLEARDSYIHGHSQRVARHAVRIGRAMGLSGVEVAKLRTAAEVHDVGKLYTPRAILNNPRRLSDWEFAVVKQHAACGAEMVSAVGDPDITAMVRHHHERIDGGGYPDGLAGASIPLGARIIAVADTFDAITSDRPYRRARSHRPALDIIEAESGLQLDADAVAAFKQGYSARRSVALYAFAATAAQRAAVAMQSLVSNLGVGAASIGALAPALGAAGALAISPGLFRVSRSAQQPGGSAALLQPLPAAGEAGSGRSGRPRPGDGRVDAPTLSRGPLQRLRAGIGSPVSVSHQLSVPNEPAGSPTPSGANAGAPGAGGVGQQPVSPPGKTGAGSPVLEVPKVSAPPVAPPQVTVPGLPTPGVSTPSVSTPQVSTPSVTTPSVSAGGVTVPSVTVPSVTVPSVTTPSGAPGGAH